MSEGSTASVERYLDKSEIQDVLLRYARGADRRDMEMIRSVYHPDAYDDHGDYKGGVDGLIDWIAKRHADIPQSMHFLGNCLIEFEGDNAALVETYFSRRRVTPAPGQVDQVVNAESLGRYVDYFEKRQGQWKIKRRAVVYDAVLSQTLPAVPRSPEWCWGSRDEGDAIFQMRQHIRSGMR